MSRVVDTPACRPVTFVEAIIEVQPLPTKLFNFRGKFLVGFSPTLPACTGARVCVVHFLPPRRKRGKIKKKVPICSYSSMVGAVGPCNMFPRFPESPSATDGASVSARCEMVFSKRRPIATE
ncbi:hypothetical protein EVAR_28873_1 [Eumeta japonica]|uniref:Uncharacterized protein n=1 Tax=Eumeta variegata TaxID=151549 RepID=A0A4C1WZE7_EUMVA|nr:hypothetical protein EVAR_28873_1 [Eumeta japonica]